MIGTLHLMTATRRAVVLVLLLAAVRKAVTDHVVMDAGFVSGTFPQAPLHTPACLLVTVIITVCVSITAFG